MPLPTPIRRFHRYRGYDYSRGAAMFITFHLEPRIPVFGKVVDGRMEYSEVGMIARRVLARERDRTPDVQLKRSIIMPEHVRLRLYLRPGQKEPLRKYCDFKDYLFKKSWFEENGKGGDASGEEIDEIRSRYEAEISKLNHRCSELERDNDQLQRRNDAMESENRKLDKEMTKSFSEISRAKKEKNDAIEERNSYREELNRVQAESMINEMKAIGANRDAKERYKPLINLPQLGPDKKEEILDWINEY